MLKIKIFDIDAANPSNYEADINKWLAELGEDVELVETKYTPYTWRNQEDEKETYIMTSFIVRTKPPVADH